MRLFERFTWVYCVDVVSNADLIALRTDDAIGSAIGLSPPRVVIGLTLNWAINKGDVTSHN